MKIISFLLLLFAVTLAHPQSNPAPSTISLQLAGQHQFEFAGYYAAQAQGYYREAGLEIEFKVLETGIHPVTEVLTGRATYGIWNSDLMLERLSGQPVVMLANFQKHSPSVLMTHPAIRSPLQLKGKTIVGTAEQQGMTAIRLMLRRYGLDPEQQVTWLPHSFDIADLATQRVDAMAVDMSNQPFEMDQLGAPYTILDPHNYGIAVLGDYLFTSEKTLAANPEQTDRFVAASIKGWEYALANPDEIIELILQTYSQTKSPAALAYEANVIEQLIMPSIYALGEIDEDRIDSIAQRYLGLGSMHSTAQLDGFIHYSGRNHRAFTDAPHNDTPSMFSKQETAELNNKARMLINSHLHEQPQKTIKNANFILFIPHDRPFWQQLTEYAQAVAHDLAVDLTIINIQNDTQIMLDAVESACQAGVDGIIFQSYTIDTGEAMLQRIDECQIPSILINSNIGATPVKPRKEHPYLIAKFLPNDFQAGYDLLKTLVSAASQVYQPQALHILAIDGSTLHEAAIERKQGREHYLKTLGKVASYQTLAGDWTTEHSATLFAQAYAENPHINVIWVASDEMAMGAVQQIKALGIEKPIYIGAVICCKPCAKEQWPPRLAGIFWKVRGQCCYCTIISTGVISSCKAWNTKPKWLLLPQKIIRCCKIF